MKATFLLQLTLRYYKIIAMKIFYHRPFFANYSFNRIAIEKIIYSPACSLYQLTPERFI